MQASLKKLLHLILPLEPHYNARYELNWAVSIAEIYSWCLAHIISNHKVIIHLVCIGSFGPWSFVGLS